MTLSRSKKNYNPGQESVRHWITTLVLVTVNIATIFPCVDWIDRIPAPTTWNEDRVSRFRPAFTDIRSRYGSQHYSIIKGEFDGFRVTFATFDWFLRSMAIHIDCTCRWGPTDTWFPFILIKSYKRRKLFLSTSFSNSSLFLSDSPFLNDLEHIIRIFDKTTKLRFRNAEEPQYVKFGSTRDNDEGCNIRFGQLKLKGWILSFHVIRFEYA